MLLARVTGGTRDIMNGRTTGVIHFPEGASCASCSTITNRLIVGLIDSAVVGAGTVDISQNACVGGVGHLTTRTSPPRML